MQRIFATPNHMEGKIKKHAKDETQEPHDH